MIFDYSKMKISVSKMTTSVSKMTTSDFSFFFNFQPLSYIEKNGHNNLWAAVPFPPPNLDGVRS